MNAKTLADCFVKLKKAFPKLPSGWYDILQQFLIEEKFTDQRFIDATNNLIKSCIYPEPTIANILGYDKTYKIFSYDEALEYSKDFSTERRQKFWLSLEFDRELNLWKERLK